MHPSLSGAGATTVALRAVTAEDFPELAAMRRDQTVQSLLLTVPAATTDEAVRGWIQRRASEPGGAFRVVTDASSGAVAGFVQVTQVHRRNGTGYGGLALTPEWRGKGIGRATLNQLLQLAAKELTLVKLLAEIRTDNTASLNLHLSLGYREVGRLDSHFLDADGRRHNVLLVERLLSDANP